MYHNKREELFECSRLSWEHMGCLKVDTDCMYLLLRDGGYNLIRIPLYGGKVKGIKNAGGYLELSDDSIFFFAGADNAYVYRVDKELKGKRKAVTKTYYYRYGLYTIRSAPFYYADGHLVVQGYNKKERKVVICMLNNEYVDYSLAIDAKVNYAPDWYWVSEDGEVEDTIKGTGVKKKWKKEYKKYH